MFTGKHEEPMEMESSWLDGHTSPMETSSADESYSHSTPVWTRSLPAALRSLRASATGEWEPESYSTRDVDCSDKLDYTIGDGVAPNPKQKRFSMSAVATCGILTKRKMKRHSDVGFAGSSGDFDNQSTTIRSLGGPASSRTSLLNSTLNKLDESYYQSKGGCLKKLIFVIIFCFLVLFLSWIQVETSWKCETQINIPKLKQKLKANVFGQHIAIDVLISAIEEYQSEENNNKTVRKPLVMSFHGWTGVGKNHIGKLIEEVAESPKMTSFLVPLHFAHSSMDSIYGKNIDEWIKSNISRCGLTMFLIDEMDKASGSILTAFKTAILDMSTKKLENTAVIFIILSNSKSVKINDFLFRELSRGREREMISYEELLTVFQKESDKEWYHNFLLENLIDVYVPFLPLAEEHVKQCIQRNLKVKGRQPDAALVSEIASELLYFTPPNLGTRFSLTGCKRVSDKVDLHLYD